MSRTILVAPREVHDLVVRCARVGGCTAGVADRLALNVTTAEVQLGAAIEVLVGVMEGGHLADSPMASAPDVLAAAEVAARSEGAATAQFDRPVPLAGLAAAIRGAEASGAFVGGVPDAATAATSVTELVLEAGAAVPRDTDPGAEATGAFRNGLEVDRAAFDRLVEVAGRFLVSEAILDGIES